MPNQPLTIRQHQEGQASLSMPGAKATDNALQKDKHVTLLARKSSTYGVISTTNLCNID